MRKKLFAVSLITAIAGLFFLQQMPVETSGKNDKFRRSKKAIPNRYIVVLNDRDDYGTETQPANHVIELSNSYRMRVDKKFDAALKGYSAEMTESDALRLSDDPLVKYVEEDAVVQEQAIQTDATWGIGRVDQRNFVYPLDTSYEYNQTGQGVSVYVLDSGILTSHPEFGGRAFDAYDAYASDQTPIENCNGHGTHVAGTIGSSTFGIAKGVNIYSVRVLPCSGFGTSSSVIAGVDWVTRNAVRPAVANMSLASVRSDTIEQAVRNSINSGVTYVASAGNYNSDACNYSPAHLAEVITVGAIDNRDYRDPNTNYGSCVDVFAPGVGIRSTWNTDIYAFNMSGTSTAAPHVAGVAALYLQLNPAASPAEVSAAIVESSTSGVVGDAGQGSPNRLLYSIFPSVGVGPSCAGKSFQGSLSGGGASNYQSSLNGFTSGTGTISGKLDVPEDSTFVLSLEQKKGKTWGAVANSSGTSNTESVSYKGKSGTYRWRIRSVYGSGNYGLCSVIP